MNESMKIALIIGAMLLIVGFGWMFFVNKPPTPNPTNNTSLCPTAVNPVCGSDGRTYDNDCLARKAGTSVSYSGQCQSELCSETDNGKDALVKGTTTKGSVTNTDTCLNSASLTEYYCANNTITNSNMDCPTGMMCSDGACIRSPVSNLTNTTCTDNDNGLSYYVAGTVAISNGSTYNDQCIGPGTVREYTCSNGSASSVTYDCPAGDTCQNGRCTSSSSCTDSDGGSNRNTRGNVTTIDSRGVRAVNQDYCLDSATLVEYTCDGNNSRTSNITCSGSCVDGRCTSTTPAPTCTDSDGGRNYATRGVVSSPDGSTGTDSCSGSNLVEYYCDGNTMRSVTYTPIAGERCDNGAIVSSSVTPTPSGYTCDDPDGRDSSRATTVLERNATTGEVTGSSDDYCRDSSTVVERICGLDGRMDQIDITCTGGTSCVNGACVSPGSPVYTCNDPDGSSTSTATTTSATSSAGASESVSDSCDGTAWVYEGYCTPDGRVTPLHLVCPSGTSCSAGACVSIPTFTPSCTDSDIGTADQTTVFGNASGYTSFGPYTQYDSCDGRNVKEWTCSGTTATESTMTCPLGSPCSGGACTLSCERPDPDSTATDPYTHGVTYDGARALPDSCLDANTIRKFTCDSGHAVLRDFSCGPGAYCDATSGRCMVRCRDSDGGYNIGTGGQVSYGSSTSYDSCLASGNLIENYCDGSGVPAQAEVNCASSGLRCMLDTSGYGYCG